VRNVLRSLISKLVPSGHLAGSRRDDIRSELIELRAQIEALQRQLEIARRAAHPFSPSSLPNDAPGEVSERLRQCQIEMKRVWIRHRPVGHVTGKLEIVEHVPEIDDSALVDRIISAYRSANDQDIGSKESFWISGLMAEAKHSIHEALLLGHRDRVSQILRKPGETALLFGFENFYDQALPRAVDLIDLWEFQAPYDILRRLAEILGTQRMENPESYYHGVRVGIPSIDQLLSEIEVAVGFPIELPNYFVGESGLGTSRGVATYRAFQAIYQAYRIAELVKGNDNARVLEIGGGLGRTAYYAAKFGVRDYTMIDLPMTGVAQSYFLGRSLGQDAVQLYGENRKGGMRILPPASFFEASDKYDLILNVDSMTEMAYETASHYWHQIRERTPLFLSVNHESNDFTVRDLYLASKTSRVLRTPYSLRRGYIEEVVYV
jgi:hypothetical protein